MMSIPNSPCVLAAPPEPLRVDHTIDFQEPTASIPLSARREPARRENFYYGWVILPLAMLAMVATSPGQTFGVSIFNEPMRQSLGLSYGQLAGAYTLGTLLGAIPIMYVGAMIDRYGLRKTMLAILTLFCLACVLTGIAQSWIMITAAFCLLRMLGPGALSLVSSSMLPFWFDRRLGLVEGLRSLGHAGSMAVVPAINLWLVNHLGWRGAYLLFGVAIWATLFPIYWLLFRNRPEDVGQRIDGRQASPEPRVADVATEAETATEDSLTARPLAINDTDFSLSETLKTYSFWVASLGTASFGLVLTAMFFSMVPIFQERGLTERDAASSMMAFAISLAVMQLIGGVLADRMKSPPLLALGLAGCAAGMAMLAFANSAIMAIAALLVLGATLGLHSGAVQPLWARYFGRRHLGKIRGMLTTLNIAFSSVGPLIAGSVRDLSGSFDIALWLFIAIPCPLAILSWFATAPTPPLSRNA